MLIGRNITKSYGEVNVLKEVDITISPGKVTVLIGPSGAGKTTLIRALALLDPPDRGRVEVDSKIYNFPSDNHKIENPPWPHLTVVFQQLFLWPHLTLRDNIVLPLKLNNIKIFDLDKISSLFKMEEYIDRYPNEVSIGQRQRAALARAFMLNPTYILLDEITSALDLEQSHIILNYLILLKEKGIGMLVVTHQIEFARRLIQCEEGDYIAFLGEGGSIIESGGVNLLDNPKTSRLKKFLSEKPISDIT